MRMRCIGSHAITSRLLQTQDERMMNGTRYISECASFESAWRAKFGSDDKGNCEIACSSDEQRDERAVVTISDRRERCRTPHDLRADSDEFRRDSHELRENTDRRGSVGRERGGDYDQRGADHDMRGREHHQRRRNHRERERKHDEFYQALRSKLATDWI
jgi:hypothetical protein